MTVMTTQQVESYVEHFEDSNTSAYRSAPQPRRKFRGHGGRRNRRAPLSSNARSHRRTTFKSMSHGEI